jgi:hypothetical protein
MLWHLKCQIQSCGSSRLHGNYMKSLFSCFFARESAIRGVSRAQACIASVGLSWAITCMEGNLKGHGRVRGPRHLVLEGSGSRFSARSIPWGVDRYIISASCLDVVINLAVLVCLLQLSVNSVSFEQTAALACLLLHLYRGRRFILRARNVFSPSSITVVLVQQQCS